MFLADDSHSRRNPNLETSVIGLALLLLQQPAAARTPTAYWQQEVAYEIDGPAGRAERRAERHRADPLHQPLARHAHDLLAASLSQRLPARLPLVRRRLGRRAPPLQRSARSRLRLQSRAQRADHGRAGASRCIPLRRTAPSCASIFPGRCCRGSPCRSRWIGTPAPPRVPRRQGRQGRRFDFAQWYPKVVVYDRYGWEEHPLYPAGEFYGEFGSFLVDLDVPEDQVVGATGVPVCGDPGWERANRAPSRAVEYQRDYYGARTPSADACERCGARAKEDPVVRRGRAPLRAVAEPRLPLRGRPLRGCGRPRAVSAGRRGQLGQRRRGRAHR